VPIPHGGADKLCAAIRLLEIAIRKGSADAKSKASRLVEPTKEHASLERAEAFGDQRGPPTLSIKRA
jgi:hypothetical protein